MTRRILSFLVALAVLCSSMAATVHADTDDNWTQVLSYSTVNNSGSNYFVVNKTSTIFLELPLRTYGVWIDMLVSTSDMDINTVYSIWNGSYTALTVKKVDEGLHRVYGRMSYHTYTRLQLQFNCSGMGYYELLSCRICSLAADGTTANATVDLVTSLGSYSAGVAEIIEVPYDPDERLLPDSYQAVITIKDATKYDKLTVYGAVNYASINSIRATYGGIALDYTINFIDVESEAAFWGEGYEVAEFGKYIYAINIDLSQINRSQENYCLVYLGGDFDRQTGMEFNCQSATGYVTIADTADATWWTRFTTFMRSLFSPDDSVADDFQNEAEQQGSEMDELNQQMQEVTKPPVEDIEIDIDDYLSPDDLASVTGEFAQITGDETVITMLMMSLTVALVAYILYGKR